MARPLGDVDMVPLWAALAGHAHAVRVAVLPASAACIPLPIEVLHHNHDFRGALTGTISLLLLRRTQPPFS